MSIFILGSSKGSPFQEPIDGVDYEMNALIKPQRRLVMTQVNGILTADQQKVLQDFADWKTTFPVQNPTVGRSLYGVTNTSAKWPVKGVKMKGAGGLRREKEKWLCYSPKPQTNYEQATEFHIAIGLDLTMKTVAGKPKALNSLRTDAAENEYDLQELLAASEVGFRGLMAGEFQTNDGRQEQDLHGNKTGAVFVEYDPAYELMGNFLKYCLIERRGSTTVLHQEAKGLSDAEATPHGLIENYISFSARMARAKHQAIVIAGVGRHAGHYDNFLFNQAKDRTYITDVDSATALKPLDDAERGVQLLRDMGRDMQRMISTLSYYSYSGSFLSALENGTHKPFEAFLRGYLGDSIVECEIIAEAESLQKKYLEYVKTKKGRLDWIGMEMRQALTTGKFPVPERQMNANWDAAHQMFTAECLESAYRLIKKSNLSDRGFTLPDIAPETLTKQFSEGMLNHCKALQDESARVTGERLEHMH